ncbi:MAG: hypothetical protein ABFS37_12330 [Acidobacteriota bacterium]
MMILESLARFFSYLAGKRSEVQAMDVKDVVMVEVERYHFKNPRPIVAKLNRIRKMNGLIGGEP